MDESSNPAQQPAKTNAPAPGNKRRNRVIERPLINAVSELAKPELAPSVNIVDPKLGKEDLKIEIQVNVHGRNFVFVNCHFEAPVYDGLQPSKKFAMHQTFSRLMKEMHQTVAAKLNDIVAEDPPARSEGQTNGKGKLINEKIPHYSEPDEDLSEFHIHQDPEIGVNPPNN